MTYFEIEERINCNILITIQEKKGNDGFKGQIQVQSTRPVYNTSYNTTTFNHLDKDFEITYLRNYCSFVFNRSVPFKPNFYFSFLRLYGFRL